MEESDNDSKDAISSPVGKSSNTLDASDDTEIGWECGSQYYELLERVGKGAFAEVFAARCSSGRREGTGVAIKVHPLLSVFAKFPLCDHSSIFFISLTYF